MVRHPDGQGHERLLGLIAERAINLMRRDAEEFEPPGLVSPLTEEHPNGDGHFIDGLETNYFQNGSGLDIGVDEAWRYTRYHDITLAQNSVPGEAIRIAVIDSGVDYTHDLLYSHIFADIDPSQPRGWDFKENDAFAYDTIPPSTLDLPKCAEGDKICRRTRIFRGLGAIIRLLRPGAEGHGTHVAGIAQRVSGSGVILPLRIDYSSRDFYVQVKEAVKVVRQNAPRIKAVIMIAVYKLAVRFIERLRSSGVDMIFTNLSEQEESALREVFEEA